MSQILERRFYPKGKVIVQEGDDAYVAFIIQSGTVSVFSEKGGKKVEFSRLESGEIFGELALIQDCERTASIEALEDCNLIVITREAFKQKLEKTDSTIRAVVEMLSKRVSMSNKEVMKNKGVNVNSFISLLNQLFKDLLDSMDPDDRQDFRDDAFPIMKQMLAAIERHRAKLE